MTENFLTKCGKAYTNQAKKFSLFHFYDPAVNCYFFPLLEVKSDETLRKRIHDLLLNGECYDDNGEVDNDKRMALELFNCTEDGIEMGCYGDCETCNCKRMASVRPVERWN